MPPISDQARATLDRLVGGKGTYVPDESAYKFTFPRTDISLRVGSQQLTAAQAPRSWATFSPSKSAEGMVSGELILLQDEVNSVLTIALKNGLDVTGLGGTLLGEEPPVRAMNIAGGGAYRTLGVALRSVLDEISRIRVGKRGQSTSGPAKPPVPNRIDPSPLNTILSMRGTATDADIAVAPDELRRVLLSAAAEESGDHIDSEPHDC